MSRWIFPLLTMIAAGSFAGHAQAMEEAAPASSGKITLLPSFALGDQSVPAARGELGALVKEAPPDPSHPLPRVTVDVVSSKGPIKGKAIQVAARRGFWVKAVQCYRQAAFLDQSLRIDQVFGVEIAKGRAKVVSGKAGKAGHKPAGHKPAGQKQAGKKQVGKKQVIRKKGAASATPAVVTAPDPKATVEACILASFGSLALPHGKRTSATINVRIAAGDEPIPPPESPRERGSGTVDGAALDTAVAQLGPTFESCYRDSLEYAPKLWGRLAVRLKIEADGRVSEAFEHGGPFPEGRVTRCILASFRAAKLTPAQGGPVRVIVPLELAP